MISVLLLLVLGFMAFFKGQYDMMVLLLMPPLIDILLVTFFVKVD